MATRRTMVLVACSLALVQLVALCHAEQEQQQEKQEAKQELCSGEKVKLRSLSDLKRTTAEGCDEPVRRAFDDLVELVLGDENIYAVGKATGITDYYETHLKHGRQDVLPRELVRFAIAFGMQVNNQYKWYITGDFYNYVDSRVYQKSYEAIKQWTSDEGPIASLLSPIIEQGEFLVPTDFETLLSKPEREALLGLDSLEEDKLIEVKGLCQNQFRLIYEETLLPIAHLDRNGLNYKSARLSRHLAFSTDSRKHNILWSRIVFLCETVREMGDPKSEEMESSQETWFNPKLQIEDQVVDDSLVGSVVNPLKSAVDSYDVNLSEAERFKTRISDVLRSSGHSKESMTSLIERVFKDENGGDEQDEELKETKRKLLSLLDPANRSKFFKVISGMSTGGKRAGRRIARALTTSTLVAFNPFFMQTDLHAYKRDGTVRIPDWKRSDMKRLSFKDA